MKNISEKSGGGNGMEAKGQTPATAGLFRELHRRVISPLALKLVMLIAKLLPRSKK